MTDAEASMSGADPASCASCGASRPAICRGTAGWLTTRRASCTTTAGCRARQASCTKTRGCRARTWCG
eukprot:7383005-Prymnesium_polylepis.1